MKKDIFDSLLEINNRKKDIFDRLLEISNNNDYVQEHTKFCNDPVSFIEEYGKILHPIKGVIPFKPYNHQKELVRSYHENRFNIVHSARQTGLTYITAIYAFYHAFFGSNKTVIIVSNKHQSAADMLHSIRMFYESLPDFYKSKNPLVSNNRHDISFGNGSKIITTAANGCNIRGRSASLIIMDSFAYLSNTRQEEFFMSALSAVNDDGKIIITSTAVATDTLFKDIWINAVRGTNAFIAHNIKWNDIHGRDNKFKEEMISIIGKQQWKVEYECLTMIKDNHNGSRSKSKFKET